jgi:UDP-N-acetylmuramate--alanine ligase
VTYGFSPQADVQASGLRFQNGGELFDVAIRDRVSGSTRLLEGVKLGLLGRHNVSNALAADANARECGIGDATLREALAGLQGVKRLYTRTGVVAGITIIDDYGHHPEEIRAVLRTARAAAPGRVIAVVQPHRYSRLQGLLEEFCTCFGDADTVVVAPVYAAGEAPIAGINRDALVRGLRAHGQRDVRVIAGPEDLATLVEEVSRDGDVVVFLGAGSLIQCANALPDALRARLGEGDCG